MVGKDAAGLEARLQKAPQALDEALGLGVARLADEPADAQRPQKRAKGLGRPAPPACSDRSRSVTRVAGSAPRRSIAGHSPARMSGASLEKTSVPAPARENPSVGLRQRATFGREPAHSVACVPEHRARDVRRAIAIRAPRHKVRAAAHDDDVLGELRQCETLL
jgi:hypothetical protein